MEGNLIGKSILFTIIIFVVLNLVFMMIMVLLGYLPDPTALTDSSKALNIGSFFGLISLDPNGFVASLFAPAGSSFLNNFMALLANLSSNTEEFVDFYGIGVTDLLRVDKLQGITYGLGLAFLIVLFLAPALIVRYKIAPEEPKAAYIGFILGILICSLIPMLMSIIKLVFPMEVNHPDYVFTTLFVSTSYYPPAGMNYFLPWLVSLGLGTTLPVFDPTWGTFDVMFVIFNAIFTGVIFGGLAYLFGSTD